MRTETDRASTQFASRLRSKVAILALAVVAGAAVTGAAMAASAASGTRERQLDGVRRDGRRHPPLAPDRDHAGQRAAARPRLLGRLREARSVDQEGPAVVPADRRRHALRDHGRRPHLRADAATGAVKWHWAPANRGVFKNFGIVANRGVAYCDGNVYLATLDMQLFALNARTGKLVHHVAMGGRGAGRDGRLRLLGDEPAGLFRPPPPDRRRGLRLRRARLLHGLAHRPPARLGAPLLDDPAGRAVVAEARPHGRRRRRLDAELGRSAVGHRLLRHRPAGAALRAQPAARPQPAHRLADRARRAHRQAALVAAAAVPGSVGLRHLAAADGLHGQRRRAQAAHRLGGEQGRPLVRV